MVQPDGTNLQYNAA